MVHCMGLPVTWSDRQLLAPDNRLAGSQLDFLEVRRVQSEEMKSAAVETEAAILNESISLEPAPAVRPAKLLQRLSIW